MNKEQRRAAAYEQIQTLFESYSYNWRLSKVLLNIKLINERYSYLTDIVERVYPKWNPEAIIARDMKNGLAFEALVSSVQYIEDLFALLVAGHDIEYFIKKFVTYDAGVIKNVIFNEVSQMDIIRYFYLPVYVTPFSKSKEEALESFVGIINELREFYKKTYFIHNQYKHGSKAVIKGIGNITLELIEQDKRENMEPYLLVFDSKSFDKVSKRHKGLSQGLMFPIAPATQKFSKQLQSEDNFLRYYALSPDITLLDIEAISILTKDCIATFVNNLFLTIGNETIDKFVIATRVTNSYSNLLE